MDQSVLNPLNPTNRKGLLLTAFLLLVAIPDKRATGCRL